MVLGWVVCLSFGAGVGLCFSGPGCGLPFCCVNSIRTRLPSSGAPSLHTSLRARSVAVSVQLTCLVPQLVSHSREVCLTLSPICSSISMKSTRVVIWNSGDPSVILERLGTSIHPVDLPRRVLLTFLAEFSVQRTDIIVIPSRYPHLAHITSFSSCIAGPTWNPRALLTRFWRKHLTSQVVSPTHWCGNKTMDGFTEESNELFKGRVHKMCLFENIWCSPWNCCGPQPCCR